MLYIDIHVRSLCIHLSFRPHDYYIIGIILSGFNINSFRTLKIAVQFVAFKLRP